MKKTAFASLFALILIVGAVLPAGAFEIGARGLYWFPSLEADIKADNAGVVGTKLNLSDDLGVDDESFPGVEIFGEIGKHSLSLSYMPIDYSGSKTLAVPINFNGQSYTAGTLVATDLELEMIDLKYRYKFLDVDAILAGLSLAAVGQIKYLDGRAQIDAPALGKKAEFTIEVPVPMVGAEARFGILAGLLEAKAGLTGAFYSGNYLYEGGLDLSLTPFPFVAINAGYKIMHIKIDEDDAFLDSRFSGPYVGLTVSF